MKKEALGVSETLVITYDCTLAQNLHHLGRSLVRCQLVSLESFINTKPF